MVSFNCCVRPSPRTKVSFFLLTIYTEELLSTLKMTTFLTRSKPGNEKSEKE